MQEPTPDLGRRVRHRGRVRRRGLDRRRGGRRQAPGPRPSISISPAPRSRVSSVTTYATAAPNDSVIVSGTFMDANPAAALTASIDWGDGSPPTVVDLPAGSYAFSAPHDYTTDPASALQHRRDLERRQRRDPPSPRRPSPSATRPRHSPRPGLVLSSSSIVENGTVTRQRNDREPRRDRHQHGLDRLGRRLDRRPRSSSRRATTRSRHPIRT